MVISGHVRTSPPPRSKRRCVIDVVRWRPPGAYPLALEVMSIAQLRQRASPEHFLSLQRVEFYILMVVTRGRTRHQIDFEPVDARTGTWMLLRPGQLQRFDFSKPWSGWAVVFRPDLLPPAERRQHSPLQALKSQVDQLRNVVRLPPGAHKLCCATVERMRADAALDARVDDRNALLLYQLGSLLTRLRLHAAPAEPAPRTAIAAEPFIDEERVARLSRLLESDTSARHQALWYAERLGCSAKTPQRAVQQVRGQSLKQLVDQRIALEAQRRLVHTLEPIKRVADGLGFDDTSNFVKFFRRSVGSTPSAFRRTQQG